MRKDKKDLEIDKRKEREDEGDGLSKKKKIKKMEKGSKNVDQMCKGQSTEKGQWFVCKYVNKKKRNERKKGIRIRGKENTVK